MDNFINCIPVMTGPIAFGGEVTAFNYFDGRYYPYYVFDDDQNSIWHSYPLPNWIQYKFSQKKCIKRYFIQAYGARSIASWRLEGSNDNRTFAVLDSREQINNWGNYEIKYFTVQKMSHYLYYRVTVLATVNNDAICISRIGMEEGKSVFQLEEISPLSCYVHHPFSLRFSIVDDHHENKEMIFTYRIKDSTDHVFYEQVDVSFGSFSYESTYLNLPDDGLLLVEIMDEEGNISNNEVRFRKEPNYRVKASRSFEVYSAGYERKNVNQDNRLVKKF